MLYQLIQSVEHPTGAGTALIAVNAACKKQDLAVFVSQMDQCLFIFVVPVKIFTL